MLFISQANFDYFPKTLYLMRTVKQHFD